MRLPGTRPRPAPCPPRLPRPRRAPVLHPMATPVALPAGLMCAHTSCSVWWRRPCLVKSPPHWSHLNPRFTTGGRFSAAARVHTACFAWHRRPDPVKSLWQCGHATFFFSLCAHFPSTPGDVDGASRAPARPPRPPAESCTARRQHEHDELNQQRARKSGQRKKHAAKKGHTARRKPATGIAKHGAAGCKGTPWCSSAPARPCRVARPCCGRLPQPPPRPRSACQSAETRSCPAPAGARSCFPTRGGARRARATGREKRHVDRHRF